MILEIIICGPNEALVISGCCYNKPLLVPGGRAFVWPTIQQVQRISLNVMTLNVTSPRVYTAQGVPISVTGIAQVCLLRQQRLLSTGQKDLLGTKEQLLEKSSLASIEARQGSQIGEISKKEIYKDRKKFNQNVFEVASSDLINMGITVLSYTLKDIHDDEIYQIR
ncbi:unnamed protein product, partial [Meganyctiphanes norvegica]